ncbi:MAG: hypothetical protein U1F63_09975 [Chitinivorax sp.]
MEALIYWLRGRIAASRGARKLAYLHDMSRFLRAGLLALHPARRINQRFPMATEPGNSRFFVADIHLVFFFFPSACTIEVEPLDNK